MNINFVCRASKARKNGESPIEMSVIINGERSIITLDRRINPKTFNPASQNVRGDKEINEYLDVIRRKCYTIETELIRQDNFNLETFVHSFKYGVPSKANTLLKVYDQHNELYKDKVLCGQVDNAALYKYKKSRERLAEYLKTLNKADIRLQDITPAFVEGYQNYCLKTLKNNTTNKQLKMLKKILSYAVKERLLDVNPFQLTLKEEKLDYHTLTLEDVKYLMGVEIKDERIAGVRDLFCLQSMTGLSYADMMSLTKDDNGQHHFDDFKKLLQLPNGESKFSYKTRFSSSDFCNMLVSMQFQDIDYSDKYSKIIHNSDFNKNKINRHSERV